ncbi:MAG: ribosomal-processing cysteine protease Prp [Spirochaetaceae bacterium]|jgi:uncharacterized protein YsxB (DUF464 family)|nr:ribosomal-processing cysteine protease Prp [Spirochaetaceae bacterium]
MIAVQLARRADGQFVSCAASGHALTAPAGSDILCAAVTVLLRTTANALSLTEGLDVRILVPKRGALSFSVCLRGGAENQRDREAQLRFVWNLLHAGFQALQAEYPLNISLNETTVEIEVE